MRTIRRRPRQPDRPLGAGPDAGGRGPGGPGPDGHPATGSRAELHAADDRLSAGNKATLAVFFALLALLVVGSVVRLPYAITSPGPTVNTLGDQDESGTPTPLIVVADAKTYPTSGTLNFTTVRLEGGPGYPVDLWDVLGGWLDPARDVAPVDEVFDPRASQEQIEEENAVQMEGSQQEATAVALRALGKAVPTHIVVAGFTESSKAREVLKASDRIEKVGDTVITSPQQVRDAVQRVRPGDPLDLVVGRAGRQVPLTVTTVAGPEGRTVLGVMLGLDHDFPVKVTINAGAVGGPSAGLMFSLGIYDKLTPGALTGDRHIAGTGTIDDAATVGPIGGIKQKMAGAHDGGADYFLAPGDNCDEVRGNIPDGLEVFRVGTFDEARTVVEGIAAGKLTGLPRC